MVFRMGALQGGCSTLIITCRPLAGIPQSLLTFQNGLGGPPPGNVSSLLFFKLRNSAGNCNIGLQHTKTMDLYQ